MGFSVPLSTSNATRLVWRFLSHDPAAQTMVFSSGDHAGPTVIVLASCLIARVRAPVPSAPAIINEFSRRALLTRRNDNRSPLGEKLIGVSTPSSSFLGELPGSAT